MDDAIIVNYCFDEGTNRFILFENTATCCLEIPEYFYISKIEQTEKLQANHFLVGRDLMKQPIKRTGLRGVRPDILYGDKWTPTKKSFMILRYLNRNSIELHFFDGWCPVDKTERSSFLTWYFYDSQIADDLFRTHHKTWEQKRREREERRKL